MLYRLRKTAVSFAYLALIWLTWQWFQGDTAWTFSIGCVTVSGLWLTLTWLQLGHLFDTYFDGFSRLKMLLPITVGLALSGLALWTAGPIELKGLAGFELFAWLVIYGRYRINRKKYITQGHGPLPKNAWVNPPVEVLQDLDLILTSGRMADRLHESVGHGEVAVRGPRSEMMLLSTYMEKGVVLHRADLVASKLLKRGHYIVLRLAEPVSELKKELAPQLGQIMLDQNIAYRDATNRRRERVIGKLPLPGFLKRWLTAKLKATGYDWVGLIIGQRHADRWTCIGICLELYHRLGIKTSQYGTGLLGLGTGMLDPVKPARFLSDKAFRILSVEDRAEFEKTRAEASRV